MDNQKFPFLKSTDRKTGLLEALTSAIGKLPWLTAIEINIIAYFLYHGNSDLFSGLGFEPYTEIVYRDFMKTYSREIENVLPERNIQESEQAYQERHNVEIKKLAEDLYAASKRKLQFVKILKVDPKKITLTKEFYQAMIGYLLNLGLPTEYEFLLSPITPDWAD